MSARDLSTYSLAASAKSTLSSKVALAPIPRVTAVVDVLVVVTPGMRGG